MVVRLWLKYWGYTVCYHAHQNCSFIQLCYCFWKSLRFNRMKFRLMSHMCKLCIQVYETQRDTHIICSSAGGCRCHCEYGCRRGCKSIGSTYSLKHKYIVYKQPIKGFLQTKYNWQLSIWTKFRSHSFRSYTLWCCISLIGQLSNWKVR